MKTQLKWVSVLVLMMSALGYCDYPGDCNGDMVVDDFDFNAVITNFGGSGPAGDSNEDGIVDDFDFNAVITNFGADARNNYQGEMVFIPAGDFQMGNSNLWNDAVYRSSYPEELPQHWVTLSGYWIGKHEVTRGEYGQFINAGGYTNSAFWSSAGWSWKGSRTQPLYWLPAQQDWGSPPGIFTQTDNHPVVGVSYYEAEAFCNWAGGHLPKESQWEKAARWNPNTNLPKVYPWGDSWDQLLCNNWNDSINLGNQTSPVGSYLSGASSYGCLDMTGNVWEWCKDWYKSYPGSSSPFDHTGNYRVFRGGSWNYGGNDLFRCAYRSNYGPSGRNSHGGFRYARTPHF